MMIFGLSTIPIMFSLGFVTKFLQQSKIRKTMLTISAILITIYGIMTLYKGYNFISNPKITQSKIDKMRSGGVMKCEVGKCG